MLRHPLLAFSTATALAFTAPIVRASGPTEWSQLDRDAAAACLKAAGMADATVSPATARFSDTFGIDARMVTGRYPQSHMNGAHGTMLCLYDRRTRHAEASDAGAALVPSDLPGCYDNAANRIEVGQCLDRNLVTVRAELSDAVKAMHWQMKKLDEATARQLATNAFDGSQEAFDRYRESDCGWLAAKMSSGTGSGDVARDCMIRMTRTRTEELRAQLNAAGGATQREPLPQNADLKDLTGGSWRLIGSERNGRQMALLPESTPSIEFDETGHVSGNASINRFSGGYSIEASGTLQWSKAGFAATRMAGSPELMQQEAEFLEALNRVERARVENGTLILGNDEQTIVLTFRH